MDKSLKLNTIVILALFGVLILIEPLPIFGEQSQEIGLGLTEQEILTDKLIIFQNNTLIPISSPLNPGTKVVKRIKVIVTAYSSTSWETDNDPYITAAGTWVRDGIIANNLLAFGTKIRIPEIYGDKVFVVEDRMHWRKGLYQFDIWMDSYKEAKDFGAKVVEAEILEN